MKNNISEQDANMENTGKKTAAAILRQKAEDSLKSKPLKSGSQLTESDALKFVHELQVHQIELELQNEELLLSKSAAQDAAEKYTELYDFAPSGYFTISKEDEIIELNISGSQMLGKERSRLKTKRLGFFISDDTKPIYNLFVEKVFKSKIKESCEVTLSADGRAPLYVYVTGIVTENSEQSHIAMVDITERKKVEDALRKSESQMCAITDSAQDAILMMDQNGRISFWNPAADRIFGYTGDEAIGKDLHQLIAPQRYHEAHQTAFVGFLQTGQGNAIDSTLELEARHKNGHEIFVELSLSSLHLQDCWHSVGIIRDITKRKQAALALCESEDRFRKLFELNSAVTLILNPDTGNIIEANKAAADYYGWSIDELKKMQIQEINTLSPETVKSEIEKTLSSGSTRHEFRHRTADGSICDVEVFSTKIEISGKVFLYSIIHDITDRKLSEQAQRESESRLQTLVQTIPDLIWLKDPEGVYLYCNDKFGRFFGAAEKDIIGKTDYDFVDRELADFFLENDRKAMAAGKPISNEEWLTFASDGYRGVFDTIKTPMNNADGKLIGVLGIARDISKGKRIEEELCKSEQQLALALKTIQDELEMASKIQRSLLPKKRTFLLDTNIDWLFKPSRFISGDIFDIFQISKNCLNFYLIDVSGHGISAALLAMTLRRLLSPSNNALTAPSELTIGNLCLIENNINVSLNSPATIAKELNRLFMSNDDNDMQYFTMLYGSVNMEENIITITQAGHPPPLLCFADGSVQTIRGGSFPIGLVPDAEFTEEVFFFEHGDRVFLHSDGLTECNNQSEAEFGSHAFAEIVSSGLSLNAITYRLGRELVAHHGSESFEDDISFLAIERWAEHR